MRALRAAQAIGAQVTERLVRVELAACATDASAPGIALSQLQPVLASRRRVTPTARAAAMVTAADALAKLGGGPDVPALLVAADGLYDSSRAVEPDAVLLRRGVVHGRLAAHHRRVGDHRGAERAARAGLALLDELTDTKLETGQVSGTLTLELVLALLDTGRDAEAVLAAQNVLRRSVRPAGAPAACWIRLALASRVHLPAGRYPLARRLLGDAAFLAERNQLDAPLAECHQLQSLLHERCAELPDALTSLRAAQVAERRWRSCTGELRTLLAAEFGMPRPAAELRDELAALLAGPAVLEPRGADHRAGNHRAADHRAADHRAADHHAGTALVAVGDGRESRRTQPPDRPSAHVLDRPSVLRRRGAGRHSTDDHVGRPRRDDPEPRTGDAPRPPAGEVPAEVRAHEPSPPVHRAEQPAEPRGERSPAADPIGRPAGPSSSPPAPPDPVGSTGDAASHPGTAAAAEPARDADGQATAAGSAVPVDDEPPGGAGLGADATEPAAMVGGDPAPTAAPLAAGQDARAGGQPSTSEPREAAEAAVAEARERTERGEPSPTSGPPDVAVSDPRPRPGAGQVQRLEADAAGRAVRRAEPVHSRVAQGSGRHRSDVALADLLAEALMAYQHGRRSQLAAGAATAPATTAQSATAQSATTQSATARSVAAAPADPAVSNRHAARSTGGESALRGPTESMSEKGPSVTQPARVTEAPTQADRVTESADRPAARDEKTQAGPAGAAEPASGPAPVTEVHAGSGESLGDVTVPRSLVDLPADQVWREPGTF